MERVSRLHLTLGACLAESGDSERRLAGRLLPVLLWILAAERDRAVPRDELVEALWGEDPPVTWESSLRTAVSKVRAFLADAGFAPSAVVNSGGGYRLELGDRLVLDAERAAELLRLGERAMAAGRAETAADEASAAGRLLESPFLPGSVGPWVDSKRRHLKALLVRALELEAEASTAAGQPGRAVAAAGRAIDLEPYHEGAHRALMRALAQTGNRAEALAAYERCRALLSEELGVDPAPETRAVHQQVLRDEVTWPVAEERSSSLQQIAGGAVPPEELERLADAALWAGEHETSITARQRAHLLYLERGDRRAAARVALGLASNHGIRSRLAEAEGWFRTAARLLEGEPDCPEHGLLAAVGAIVLFETGDLTNCAAQAGRALEVGERLGIPDLRALGIAFRALALTRQDRPADALPMLDEAMTLALAGGVTPFAAGVIFCRTIRTSLDLFEYRRAAEWIDSVQRSAAQTGFGGYPGDCSAHLAAALEARGSWTEAERQAERACEACEGFELSHVGLASYTQGEIRLRRGDLAGAERAFRRASEHGVTPLPGLALLQLATGDRAAALASVEGWLATTDLPLARARVLPAAAEIALAAGELNRSREAAEELAAIADIYGSRAISAAALRARGEVALAEGDAADAVRSLRRALDLFRDAEMPYEVARVRRLVAEALLAAADKAGAALELDGAERLFESLGASADAQSLRRWRRRHWGTGTQM